VKCGKKDAIIHSRKDRGSGEDYGIRGDVVFIAFRLQPRAEENHVMLTGREVILVTTPKGVAVSRNVKIKKVEGGWMR